MKSKKTAIAITFILVQNLLYGIGDPISKTAYETVSVYSLLTIRYSIAFFAVMLIFGKRIIYDLRHCDWKCTILPSVCIASAFLVSNVAIKITSPTSVAFLKSTSTILTPLLAFFVFRKKYSAKHIPALVVVLIGLYLLCNPKNGGGFGMGEILSILSALVTAGSLVFAEDALKKVGALTITAIQVGVSALMAAASAIVFEGGVYIEGAGRGTWSTIVYLALACTLGGYLLQNSALQYISSSTVALLQSTYPVMTAVFSFFLISERLSMSGIFGALLIIGCVVAENSISENKNASNRIYKKIHVHG